MSFHAHEESCVIRVRQGQSVNIQKEALRIIWTILCLTSLSEHIRLWMII